MQQKIAKKKIHTIPMQKITKDTSKARKTTVTLQIRHQVSSLKFNMFYKNSTREKTQNPSFLDGHSHKCIACQPCITSSDMISIIILKLEVSHYHHRLSMMPAGHMLGVIMQCMTQTTASYITVHGFIFISMGFIIQQLCACSISICKHIQHLKYHYYSKRNQGKRKLKQIASIGSNHSSYQYRRGESLTNA